MEIKGKIYCFFEQSGTFKNEFRKLGYEAEDYDIQNEYGQTDHICDLFAEIEAGYDGKPSIFDSITPDDLVLAFFPCIYFCNYADFNIRQVNDAMKKWAIEDIWSWKLDFMNKRNDFAVLALKFAAIIEIRGLRMIMENPWNTMNYTNYHWFRTPSFIDHNRQLRGDYFVKPTAYWYYGCEPTIGYSFQKPKIKRRIVKYGGGSDVAKGSKTGGVCSKERSEISPDYARNFICDFIIGKVQPNTLPTLF